MGGKGEPKHPEIADISLPPDYIFERPFPIT